MDKKFFVVERSEPPIHITIFPERNSEFTNVTSNLDFALYFIHSYNLEISSPDSGLVTLSFAVKMGCKDNNKSSSH